MANTNQRLTSQDAHMVMLRASFGVFTRPDGRRVNAENMPYLLALRSKAYDFADAVCNEIERVEAEAAAAEKAEAL